MINMQDWMQFTVVISGGVTYFLDESGKLAERRF